jgi:hypothetical protein
MPLKLSRLSWRSTAARADDQLRQEVLVLCHGADRAGLGVMQNALAALGAARIRYTVMDLSFGHAWPALERYAAVLICTAHLERIGSDKAQSIASWVAAGGGVIAAMRTWHPDLGRIFGFGDIEKPKLKLSLGLDFVAELVPGATGLRIESEDWVFEHSRYSLGGARLDPACHIVVRDLAGDPIAWRREVGSGRVVFWNTNVLHARILRGVLLQSILDAMGTAAAAIVGVATINIDDFPPSLSSAVSSPIAREYPGLDESGFFFGPWLSDMLELRRRHGLRYSWYTVTDYGDDGTGPPDANATDDIARILGKRFERAGALAPGDEIGFHGYNHRPPTAEDSPDLARFRAGLELARRLWQTHVPAPLPTSWVPAGNQYHAEHAQLVADVFPEITTVSSIHSFGAPEHGEYREFGPEPWCEHLFCLPRNCFGYSMQPRQRLLLLSQIAGSGVWTHFLHPDDILDEPRPGADPGHARNPASQMWKATNTAGRPGLFREFEAFIGFVRSTFPWLRFVTNSEAAEIFRRGSTSPIDLKVGPDAIEIDSAQGGLYYLRTQNGTGITSVRGGGRVVWQHEIVGGSLYVAHCPPGRSVFRMSAQTA